MYIILILGIRMRCDFGGVDFVIWGGDICDLLEEENQ